MKNIQIKHYIGIFMSPQLSTICKEYIRMMAYTKTGIAVYIFYRRDNPFYIERIGVQLVRDFLDLFECEVFTESEIEAKTLSVTFAEELVNYRKSFLEFSDTLKRYPNLAK